MSISVVIPCYNSAVHLPDAVASVRKQTCQMSEIIIVDDGSTDETEEVVRGLGDDICFCRQDNSGPASARNHGIAMARGDWVAFLDADDQWTPDKTMHQVRALEKHPQVVLLAMDMAETDEAGNIITESMLAKHGMLGWFRELAGEPVPDAVKSLLDTNFIPTGTVLVKRAVIAESGGFRNDIRYGEDLELWARIAMRHPVACLPEVGMLRRKHASNVTHDTIPLYRDLVKVMEAVREWGGDALNDMGIDADALVAKAWADLGYCYFDAMQMKTSISSFHASIKEKVTRRACFYYTLSHLPAWMLHGMRRIRQTSSGILKRNA